MILARTDLRTADLKLSNPQAENFQTNLFFPLPPELGGGVELTRGYTAVDVKIRGAEFRVINTHLENEFPGVGSLIQVAQAQEILAGPADTDLPVLLLGDFNSRADQNGDVYELFIGAGFEDVWTETHPGEVGLTFGHDADLRNETVDFQGGRIDWILYRGDFLPLEMDLFNDELSDRTDSGLWISDHAGLVATLVVSPLPPVARRFSMDAEPSFALASTPTLASITEARLEGRAFVSRSTVLPAGVWNRDLDRENLVIGSKPLEQALDLVFRHFPEEEASLLFENFSERRTTHAKPQAPASLASLMRCNPRIEIRSKDCSLNSELASMRGGGFCSQTSSPKVRCRLSSTAGVVGLNIEKPSPSETSEGQVPRALLSSSFPSVILLIALMALAVFLPIGIS